MGSTTDVMHDTGAVDVSYEYDVFGAIRAQDGSSDNFWLFTGEQHDGDSDWYFLRARYYDPTTGGFLTRDPYGLGNLFQPRRPIMAACSSEFAAS